MLDEHGKPIEPDNNKESKEKIEGKKVYPPKTLMVISIDPQGHTFVSGPLKQKRLCIHHLCQAIEIITNYEEALITPAKGSMMNFARKIIGRG